MKTFPLQSLTIIEAQQKQFALVDSICRHFPGSEFLTGGDLGLTPGLNQLRVTQRVDRWRCISRTGCGAGAGRGDWRDSRRAGGFAQTWGSVFWCMTRLFTR